MRAKTHKTLTLLTMGIAFLASLDTVFAGSPLKVEGAIAGTVLNAMGIPQLGAAVQLYNRQDRPVGRILTDSGGRFQFKSLPPDRYSVRVSMAAFFPAIQKNIEVQPGTQSLLAVHLSSFFSTVQLTYPPMENGSLITDDWKWVLRTATSTRPVTRFVDDSGANSPSGGKSEKVALFSDTRGLLTVSAGQGGVETPVANEADLGTSFALATAIMGSNLVQVSGNLGYGSQTGVPAAAFRTTYSREMMGGSPQLSLTMRQLFLPGRLAAAASGSESSLPMLRTFSTSFDDHLQIADNVTVRYGVSMDNVTFLDRLNYLSPYIRVTDNLGNGARLDLTFTSGNGRPDLGSATSEDTGMQSDLNDLGFFPRVSVLSSRARVQRGDQYEATYSRKVGSRTYSATLYHEVVRNAALDVMGPVGGVAGLDILPDVFSASNASILNAGNFQSWGINGAVTQNLGNHVAVTVMYGNEGALTVNDGSLATGSPEELRSLLHEAQRHAATTRVDATVPWTKTHVVASYQWDGNERWATAGNGYSTEATQPMPGLNVCVRQPLPGFARRVEATADLRNMLAQGYLPVGMVSGQQLMLIETPRTLRGGLAFTF